MTISFFSDSLHDLYRDRCRQFVEYVKQLPEAQIDGIDRMQFAELTVAKFRLSDMPEFAVGDIQRDEAVFTRGNEVRTTVYFP